MKRRNRVVGFSVRKMILAFALITVMAVLSGYGLTKYIIRPLFLGISDNDQQVEEYSPEDFQGSSIIVDNLQDSILENPEEKPDKAETDGAEVSKILYSIQYGSFSDIHGAKAEASSLASSEIEVVVLEKDGAFKLVGEPFITKEQALKTLESVRTTVGSDPFITTVEVKMK